jgi:hypothetical protein
MRARTKALLAWALWLATLGCCAGGLLAALLWIRPLTLGLLATGAAQALIAPLGYATIGLVLGLRRPANPIGWLYAASGLVWALIIPFEPWLVQLFREHQPLPLVAQLAVVASQVIWAPAIALGITLPFLLLPDGRLRSRRWRVVVAAAVVGVAMFVVGGILLPGQVDNDLIAIDNPFGLAGVAGRVAMVVAFTGLVLYALCLPAALVCVGLRFRASRGVERQQLRWVAAGAAAAVLVLLPAPAPVHLPGFLPVVAVLAVPVSVAVAVLRYRLWDLDRLISRTVTYLLVTGRVLETCTKTRTGRFRWPVGNSTRPVRCRGAEKVRPAMSRRHDSALSELFRPIPRHRTFHVLDIHRSAPVGPRPSGTAQPAENPCVAAGAVAV